MPYRHMKSEGIYHLRFPWGRGGGSSGDGGVLVLFKYNI